VTPLSDANSVLCILLICALPLALAGLVILNAGLCRSRSVAYLLFGAVCLTAVAAVVYYIVGFALQGYLGGTSYALQLGSTIWDWIGARPLFLRGIDWSGSTVGFIAAFQIFAVALAALIPWGAGAGRWRLIAASASTVLLAGFIYPVFAHWVWAGGWLAHLGVSFGLGAGFVDPGGAAAIQVIGGLSALSIVWIMGPRTSKAAQDSASAQPILFVLVGCLLVLAGWLALNTLGAVLFGRLSGSSLALVEVNTLLSASSALLLAMLATRVRFGKPSVSLCANAWLAGLVASSAVAPYVSPSSALLVGGLAGAAVPFIAESLATYCGIDDPAGAITVHGFAGLWGLFALGLLSKLPAGQTLAQLVGIGTLLGVMLPIIFGINWLLNKKLVGFRVNSDCERLGMDQYALDAAAYTEFFVHGEDATPR
jgi:ammonium transporter, Amt family